MWNNAYAVGTALALVSTFLAGVSQLLLKISSGRVYKNWLREYLNPWVITAYIIFVFTTLCSVVALQFISLSLSTAIAATGQVFVPLMSYFILKERITPKKALGMITIIIGVLVFAL